MHLWLVLVIWKNARRFYGSGKAAEHVVESLLLSDAAVLSLLCVTVVLLSPFEYDFYYSDLRFQIINQNKISAVDVIASIRDVAAFPAAMPSARTKFASYDGMRICVAR